MKEYEYLISYIYVYPVSAGKAMGFGHCTLTTKTPIDHEGTDEFLKIVLPGIREKENVPKDINISITIITINLLRRRWKLW